ncbi:hypothetical protein C1645_735403 [Glomus cerebriforme]|uniref:Uncharacterized protein n=1 Tax=Glomus cerebriforme TaxID=658196 RepID=A0A397T9Q7_9GLOM|nr:hypothetical protein C1645_735403 [Glomus cerebriforme]
MVDIDFVYNVSIHKLRNFHTSNRDSGDLRKLVLLNNFVYEKFYSSGQEDDFLEWSEEDIKKDEESWLDSVLDELDEDDYVHINVKPFEHQSTITSFPIDHYDDPRQYEDRYVQDNNNAMEYENLSHEQPNHQQQQQQQQHSKGDEVIIPHDLLHLPLLDPSGDFNMVIDDQQQNDDDDDDLMNNSITSNDSSSQQDDDINMTEIEGSSENLSSELGFHPYWKDNSIISQPSSSQPRTYFDFNTRSFGIPKIFHKYRFDQDDDTSSPRRICPPNAVLELLQSDYLYQSLESPLRRSKDDLDILYSLTPKDLDRGVLMDMISMLEYYGSKTNHNKSNSSEINDIWFMDNNNHH